MTTAFWDAERNVLTTYLEHGSTFTVCWFGENSLSGIKEKRQVNFSHQILFQQHNALAHTSSQVLAAILNAKFEELPHPL